MVDKVIGVDFSDVVAARLAIKEWAKETRNSFSIVKGSISAQTRLNKQLLSEERARSRASLSLQKQKQAAIKAEGREVERLSTKYKPLYAASKQYERALEEIALAQSKGILSTKQHEAAVESLTREYQEFQNGTAGWSNQFISGSSMAGKSANRLGMAYQQLGYQVGDFAVQVQSGQSALVAFSQQATQLVGVLPMVADNIGISTKAAIALSASLGIGIPVVTAAVGALYTVFKGSQDAAQGQEELKDSIEETIKSLESANAAWREFNQGLGSGETNFVVGLKDATEELREAQAELESIGDGFSSSVGPLAPIRYLRTQREIEESQERLNEAQVVYNKYLDESLDRSGQLSMDRLRDQQNVLDLLAAELEYGKESAEYRRESNLLEQEALRLELQREGITGGTVDFLVEMLEAEQQITEELLKQAEAQKEISESQRDEANRQESYNSAVEYLTVLKEQNAIQEAINQFGRDSVEVSKLREDAERRVAVAAIESRDIAQSLKDELIAAYDTGVALGNADMAAGINSANASAQRLARTLGIAFGRALAIQNMSNTGMMDAEDAAMGQTVVSGSATDRFDRDTLLGMGYTELYLGSQGMGPPSSGSSGGGGGGSSSSRRQQTLSEITEELIKREELANAIGREGDELRLVDKIIKALGDASGNYSEEAIRASADRIVALQYEQKAFEEMVKAQEDLTNAISSELTGGLEDIVSRTKTVEEAFKDMARGIISELYEVLVVQRLVGSFDGATGQGSGLTGLIGGLVKGFVGGSASPASVSHTPIASASASASAKASSPYGSSSTASSSGDVIIQQSFSFTANGDESVKKIIAEEAPRIAKMTKNAIISDRVRGGRIKQAFGS